MYKVKVKKINTLLDSKNRKKAIIKLKKESNAQDLANKLGIL
jgi:large subunit ribosomal protein L23